MCVCIHIYIYIYIYICVYTYIHMYIYIYREREREFKCVCILLLQYTTYTYKNMLQPDPLQSRFSGCGLTVARVGALLVTCLMRRCCFGVWFLLLLVVLLVIAARHKGSSSPRPISLLRLIPTKTARELRGPPPPTRAPRCPRPGRRPRRAGTIWPRAKQGNA